jgi:hypothetical protein
MNFRNLGLFNSSGKTKFVVTLLLSTALLSFSKVKDDSDLCTVNKYNGKYIFWMCDPVSSYDEVFSIKTTLNTCTRQTAQSDAMSKEAIVQSSINKIDFDAVIVGTSEWDVAIKFKDSSADKSLGKVRRINGVPVFFDCVPKSKYIQNKRALKYRTNGKSCFSSNSLAESLTKRGSKADALLIGDDHIHWWVDF